MIDPVPYRDEDALSRAGRWWVVLLTLAGAVVVANILALFLIVPLTLRGGGLQNVSDLATDPAVLFVSVIVGDGALALAAYLLIVRRGILSWRQMGLTGAVRGHPVVRGVGWAVVFIVASTIVSTALASVGVDQTQSRQFPLQDMGVAGRVAIWVAGVLFAPVAEEIFFRGYVFRAMSARYGTGQGLVWSSVLFSLLHLNLPAFLPVAVGGAVLAYSYHRSGDLWTPIIAHALNNAFSFSILMLSS